MDTFVLLQRRLLPKLFSAICTLEHFGRVAATTATASASARGDNALVVTATATAAFTQSATPAAALMVQQFGRHVGKIAGCLGWIQWSQHHSWLFQIRHKAAWAEDVAARVVRHIAMRITLRSVAGMRIRRIGGRLLRRHLFIVTACNRRVLIVLDISFHVLGYVHYEIVTLIE